jgi:hypothetical protein
VTPVAATSGAKGEATTSNGRCRIVLTGGGGKTTAADLFRRQIGERVVIVPEAATLLSHRTASATSRR